MSAAYPLFRELLIQARREKRVIVAEVMMADDSIRKVHFGPRGGWRFCK